MAPDVRQLEPILLWPNGAAGALGDGPADKPQITPYLIEGDGPRGCIIVCPGGGYTSLAPHENQPIAEWVNSLGLAAVVLEYRLSPYLWPAMLDDAQRAIRLVRARAAEWNIDPHRVAILGFSAGGHLSASASTAWDDGDGDAADAIDRQSCRPDAAVLCYPVTTFVTEWRPGAGDRLLGPGATELDRQRISPVHHVSARTPPTFIWHTANDGMVPVKQSLIYAEALAKAGASFALHIWPDGPHGIALNPHPVAPKWSAACADWLTEIGLLPPA